MSLTIDAGTRIGALIAAHPEVQASLVEWIPALDPLNNPALDTTSLERAAAMGGLEARELVERLRSLTGQPEPEPAVCNCQHGATTPEEPMPEWVSSVAVVEVIDADAMLATGVHPIGTIRAAAAALDVGQAVRMNVGFRPEPLMEKMRSAGFRVWCGQLQPGRHSVFVTTA